MSWIKLEDGQVKLQSRLEQEEEAKAILLSRIQRLTKLILVSTKTSQSRFPNRAGPRRRHSFGEEEVLQSIFSFHFYLDIDTKYVKMGVLCHFPKLN